MLRNWGSGIPSRKRTCTGRCRCHPTCASFWKDCGANHLEIQAMHPDPYSRSGNVGNYKDVRAKYCDHFQGQSEGVRGSRQAQLPAWFKTRLPLMTADSSWMRRPDFSRLQESCDLKWAAFGCLLPCMSP